MICKKHQPKECAECIKEEIKTLEEKIAGLKAKLPKENNQVIIIQEQTNPPYRPFNPLEPKWYCGDGTIGFFNTKLN